MSRCDHARRGAACRPLRVRVAMAHAHERFPNVRRRSHHCARHTVSRAQDAVFYNRSGAGSLASFVHNRPYAVNHVLTSSAFAAPNADLLIRRTSPASSFVKAKILRPRAFTNFANVLRTVAFRHIWRRYPRTVRAQWRGSRADCGEG